ncbi:MAG: sulfatase-like hydrolase/transferase [Planctomycetota bacterium]
MRRARIQALILLSALAGCAPHQAPPAAPPSNLVIFTLDTTRADHLGCYGYARARTDTIDALAARGVLFENARTPVPLTLPAHTTIMTGLLPCEHGARDNGIFRVGADTDTLATVLAAHGFATGAFVGSFVLDASFGLARGFAVYSQVKQKKLADDGFFDERTALSVTHDAVAWLESVPRDQRFFAWVHYYDPHSPYQPPAGVPPGMHPYDAEIAFVDDQMQVVLDTLARLGRRADTLIVVTADHGEGLGEHGEDSHGFFIYDATMHVPLVFAHESFAPARVTAGVGLQDIARTVLAALLIEPPATMGGRSLLDALRGSALASAPQYLETFSPYLSCGWSPLVGVAQERYKLIRAPRPELYDLAHDPHETTNVHGADAARVASLESLVDRLVAEHSLAAARATAFSPSAEDRAKLARLGYVGMQLRPDAASQLRLADPKDKLETLRRRLRAIELLRKGEPMQALPILKALVEEEPDNAAHLNNYGVALSQVGELEPAAHYLELAAQKGDLTASNQATLGEVYLSLNRLADAEQHFRRALELQPKHLFALLKLAELLEKKGERDAALACYEQLLELWDGDVATRENVLRRVAKLKRP